MAEKGDLAGSASGDGLHVRQHVPGTTVLFGSSYVGNDAEGTAVVAASLDGDPGLRPRASALLQTLVAFGLIQLEHRELDAAAAARSGGDGTGPRRTSGSGCGRLGLLHEWSRRLARFDLEKPLRQTPVAVRPHHQIHIWRSLEERRSQTLGHAAGDTEDEVRTFALERAELPDAAEHPTLGVIAYGTRVDKHHVGVFRARDDRIALGGQDPLHQLAVTHVHLATVRLDVRAPRPFSSHQGSVFRALRSPPAPRHMLARWRPQARLERRADQYTDAPPELAGCHGRDSLDPRCLRR